MTLIILRLLRVQRPYGPQRPFPIGAPTNRSSAKAREKHTAKQIVRVQKHEKRKIIKEKEAKRKLTKKRDWDNII